MNAIQAKRTSLSELEVICAWCGVFLGTKASDRPVADGVSHGICPRCKETLIKEFKAEIDRPSVKK